MRVKNLAKLPAVVLAAIVGAALLVPAAQAATPAPGYEQFAGCPSSEEDPTVVACLHSVVKGGHFDMGSKSVPISNPIPLTGGVGAGLQGFSATSEGGLGQVKQQVPGGVIGLTGLDWLVNYLGIEQLKLYAVTELAGTPSFNGPTNISLPIKVHLINPVLGNNCYVGSEAEPIALHLITGTTNPPPPNEPITGKNPVASFDFEKQIQKLTGAVEVDNSFAAPSANGCKLTLLGFIPIDLDGVVNLASGLPSAAGTNETVQEIDSEVVPVGKVFP